MNEAVLRLMARYEFRRLEDYVRALREILQQIALLGLWRGKFFEQAAFYGGSALRILYGLDRFSEDLDFSLLTPKSNFSLEKYTDYLRKEMLSFGFEVETNVKTKSLQSPVQSAFVKLNTLTQLVVIETPSSLLRGVPKGVVLKIKVEVDTDPPGGFETESKFVLQPIPFSVRTYTLPDLFAGKLHALLCRQWKARVKGRDWYDLVWYAANHPELHLDHLEQRMRQSGHWSGEKTISAERLRGLLREAVESLDVQQARSEVEPFVQDPESLVTWSRNFFYDVTNRIQIV